MAEPQTTPETPSEDAAPPEAVTPPAAAPAAGRPQSFADRMAAEGWDPSEDPTEEEEDESDGEDDEESVETQSADPEKPAAPAKNEPARPKVVEVQGESTDLQQFRALAQKLGMEIEDKSVVPRERVGFRQWKREQQAAIEAQRQQVQAELAQHVQSANAEISFGRKAKLLLDAGDFDGLAQHVGKKDWNDLNTVALTAASDPQWKANLENRRELERLRQEREEEKRQLTVLQQRQQEQQVMQGWHANLEQQMRGSGSVFLEAFADDQTMRDAIIGIQRHYYHQTNGRELPLSATQALRAKMPGSNITLEQQMKGLYERLSKAFGGPPSPKTEAAPPAKSPSGTPSAATETPAEAPAAKKPGKRVAPTTGVVNRKDAANASGRKKWDREGWDAHVRRTLENATAEDDRADARRAAGGGLRGGDD